MYDRGNGLTRDYREAARWFRLAAEQGDASAQVNLGVMYAHGRGVPHDDKEAAKWYRLAAEQGRASAQFNLGLMYANGQGVPQNLIQAHMWFNLVAASGDADGLKARDEIATKMTPAQIVEAQRLARAWKPKPNR
jgi:TPR repeat protein